MNRRLHSAAMAMRETPEAMYAARVFNKTPRGPSREATENYRTVFNRRRGTCYWFPHISRAYLVLADEKQIGVTSEVSCMSRVYLAHAIIKE